MSSYKLSDSLFTLESLLHRGMPPTSQNSPLILYYILPKLRSYSHTPGQVTLESLFQHSHSQYPSLFHYSTKSQDMSQYQSSGTPNDPIRIDSPVNGK